MKTFGTFIVLLLIIGNCYAHVTLDSPVGGESYDLGEVVTIEWHKTVAHTQNNWDLYYSIDGGVTWLDLGIDLPVTQFSFSWTVPDIETSEARIKIVMDNANGSYEDESPNFSIGLYSPLTLVYPIGNEELAIGSEIDLFWKVNGFVNFDYWKLSFSSDGGMNWEIIEDSLPMSILSKRWKIPNAITSMARIKVEMNISGVIYEDISGIFNISESIITSLNISDAKSNGIEIFPNPFKESVTFQILNSKNEPQELIVYNSLGTLVFQVNVDLGTTSSREIVWRPAGIPNGLYYYNLQSKNKIVSGRLLYNKKY